jgi:hypothetical protein
MLKISIALVLVLFLAPTAFAQNWIIGNWEGKGYQVNTDETWDVKLQARKGKFLVEYPALECSGEWKLIKFNRNTASFRESIKVNTDQCEPTVNVFIQKLSDKQLMLKYSYINDTKIFASAILNRMK